MTDESGWQAGFLAAVESIQAGVNTARRRADGAQRAQARLAQVQASAWSPRREVRVELDSAGLVQDIEFSDGAPLASPLALSRAVTAAHARSQQQLSEQVEAIAAEELGDDPLLRESLLSTYREAMAQRSTSDPSDL